jgi:hypothetical protein
MPHGDKFSGPKMGCSASFHSDQAWRESRDEIPYLCTTQFAPGNDPASSIDAMNLKHVFRKV